MRPPPIALLLAALPLGGCGSTGLAQSWQLDRIRILGVRATPAEPQPGDRVAFESLVYAPADTPLGGVLWFACLPESADDFGCELDPSIASLFSEDLEDLSAEEQAELYAQAVEAGFVGFEPLLPPSWVAPLDALDGLDEAAQVEGVSAIVNLTAFPEADDPDGELTEIAYKRLPISIADTPNQNPDLLGFEIYKDPVYKDGTFVRGTLVEHTGTAFEAERGTEYQLVPVLADDAIETYTYTDDDGQSEDRTEQPFVTWYTEGGSFLQDFSLHPHTSTAWTAPSSSFEGVVVAVLRDRRGGMGWSSLQVVVP
jgi:hypothetical protein